MSRLIFNSDESFTIGASSDPVFVFGDAAGGDTVTVDTGASVVLDPSFNSGKDTVVLQGNAAGYTVKQSGSSVILTDATGATVTIPVGVAGTAIKFADATETLVFNTGTGHIMLGSQVVSTTANPVGGGSGSAPVTTFTLTQGIDSTGTGAFATSNPSGNSVIYGVVNNGANTTFNSADKIQATGTNNTFVVGDDGVDSTYVLNTVGKVSGVQNVEIYSSEAITFNAAAAIAGYAGLADIKVSSDTSGNNYDLITATATQTVTVTDSGAGGVVVIGGSNVSISESGAGDITVGGGTVATDPTGAVTVVDTSTGNDSIGGSIYVYGGTSVDVTTSARGDVVIGDESLASDPTGAVTVVDTSTGNGFIHVYGGTSVDVTTSASGAVIIGAGTVDSDPTGEVTVVDTSTGCSEIEVFGGTTISVTTSTMGGVLVGDATLASDPTGQVTVVDTGHSGAITVYGGSSVSVTSSGSGPVQVGESNADAGVNTAGAVDVTETGNGSVSVYGGSSVTVTETGTSSAITIGDSYVADQATGPISVTENVSAADGTIAAGAAITIVGGSTVTVNENQATLASATPPAANGTTTFGTVTVTGGANTTSVTVNEAAQTGVVATSAPSGTDAAPVAQVQSVTFAALAASGQVTVNGLTFTASQALTAQQVAAAFANLSDHAYQGTSTLGTYSGQWDSGAGHIDAQTGAVITGGTLASPTYSLAVTSDISAGALAVPGSLTPTVTTPYSAGSTATPGVAGVEGVNDGTVAITDVNATSTSLAGTITSVNLANTATGSTIHDNALATLSLSGDNAGLTVNTGKLGGNTNTTLALDITGGATADTATLNHLSVTDDTSGLYTTINLSEEGYTALTLTDSALAHLNVSGSGMVELGSALANNTAVVVSGSVGLTGLSLTGGSVDASASSGAISGTISGTSFTGGSGDDVIVVSSNVIGAPIMLGSGTNTLTLASGTTTSNIGYTVYGGSGNDNTLVMSASDAVADSTVNGAVTFAKDVSGFANLTLTGNNSGTVNLANLGFAASADTITLGGTGSLTLSGFASGETLLITNSQSDTLSNLAWGTLFNPLGSANIALSASGSGNLLTDTVTSTGLTNVTIAANDTGVGVGGPAAGTNSETLHLLAPVSQITVTGSAELVLTTTADLNAALVNASAMTGGLTYTTTDTNGAVVYGGQCPNTITGAHSGDVIYGGNGNDVLSATAAGVTLYAGGGTVSLADSNSGGDTLVGGAGADTFTVNGAVYGSSNTPTLIEGFHSGDLIILNGAAAFANTQVSNTGMSLSGSLNAAIAADANTAGNVSWFQYGGNTYLVEAAAGHTGATLNTFEPNIDKVVEIQGLVSFANASINTQHHSILG